MLNVHIGAAVMNLTPLAWKHNARLIIAAIDEAKAADIRLLCLPELCITGYGCQDAFHSPSVHSHAMKVLFEDIAPHTSDIAVAVGLPIVWRHSIFNAVAVVANGKVLGFVCKRFLAGDGVHYEPRWFKPWPTGVQNVLEVDGVAYPIGDLYFDIGGVKVGFEICEDAWVAQRPGSSMAGRGIDIILNPSASHFAFGKLETRKRFVIEGSRAFAVTYVYSNLLGCEEGRIIYDGGAMIATQGRLVAAGERFSMAEMQLTHAVVDVEQTRMLQGWTSSFRPNFSEDPDECVRAPFLWPEREPELDRTARSVGWEASPNLKEEELWRAVTLGLFDYMRRSRSRGFVVSLSGGADSTLCAALVWLMVERAVAELGLEGVKRRLDYDKRLAACTTPRELTKLLLTCAYQATRNSSDTTSNAARVVAEAVGAEFHHLDVDAMVQGYVHLAEAALGRELNWQDDDVALQNIQARVRAPSIWMFANIRGALLLTTSNRSEAAVGYTTMDGDSAGGLAPIGGIDKNYIRRWLRWLEADGPMGFAPLPAVRAVNVQQPTAELRPSERVQTDESDLMPYDLLDAIERAAIRDKQDPLETYRLMRLYFPQHDKAQLGIWVERFFLLWCRNQWKRERYAPSFHLDDQNLDPKTWCRFPILSSGFTEELTDLRAWIASH